MVTHSSSSGEPSAFYNPHYVGKFTEVSLPLLKTSNIGRFKAKPVPSQIDPTIPIPKDDWKSRTTNSSNKNLLKETSYVLTHQNKNAQRNNENIDPQDNPLKENSSAEAVFETSETELSNQENSETSSTVLKQDAEVAIPPTWIDLVANIRRVSSLFHFVLGTKADVEESDAETGNSQIVKDVEKDSIVEPYEREKVNDSEKEIETSIVSGEEEFEEFYESEIESFSLTEIEQDSLYSEPDFEDNPLQDISEDMNNEEFSSLYLSEEETTDSDNLTHQSPILSTETFINTMRKGTAIQKGLVDGAHQVVKHTKDMMGEGIIGKALLGAEQSLQANHDRLIAKQNNLGAIQEMVQHLPQHLRTISSIAGASVVKKATAKQGPNFKAVFKSKMNEKGGIASTVKNKIFPVVHEAIYLMINDETTINKAVKSAIGGLIQVAKISKDHTLVSAIGSNNPEIFEQESYKRIANNLTLLVNKKIDKLSKLSPTTRWIAKRFMKSFPQFVRGVLQKVVKEAINDLKVVDKLEQLEATKNGKEIELTGFKLFLSKMLIGAGIIDTAMFLKKNGPLVALYILDKTLQGIVDEENETSNSISKQSQQNLDEFFQQQVNELWDSGKISFIAAYGTKAISPSEFLKGALFVAREWVQDTSQAIATPPSTVARRLIPGLVEGNENIDKAKKELKPKQFMVYTQIKNKSKDYWLQKTFRDRQGKSHLSPPQKITLEQAVNPLSVEGNAGFTPYVPPPSVPQAFRIKNKKDEKYVKAETLKLKDNEYMIVAGKTDRHFNIYTKPPPLFYLTLVKIYCSNPDFRVDGIRYEGNFEDYKKKLDAEFKIKEPLRENE